MEGERGRERERERGRERGIEGTEECGWHRRVEDEGEKREMEEKK